MIQVFVIFCAIILLVKGEGITEKDETILPQLRYMNLSADPCEDFYEYSCGNFKTIHERPENEPLISGFTLLEDELLQLSREILESPDDPNDSEAIKKTRALYSSCIDTGYSNTQYLKNPELTVLDGDSFPLVTQSTKEELQFSWNEVGKYVAEYGIPLLFNIITYPHLQDKSKMTLLFQRENLNDPVLLRAEYKMMYDELLMESLTEDMPANESPTPIDIFLRNITYKMRDATNNHWVPDEIILKNLEETKAFMESLKTGLIENGTEIEALKYPSVTLKELQIWTDKHFGENNGLNWVEYISSIFSLSDVEITEDIEVSVQNGLHEIIYGTINLVRNTSPETLKNFVFLRIFLFMAPDSDAATVEAFENYFTAKGYTLYPRWEYCTRKILETSTSISSGISFGLTHAYQKYYLNKNKLNKASDLLSNIQAAFRKSVEEAEWIDTVSREKALQKADNMIAVLGYPDFVEDEDEVKQFYQNLRVCKWDNFENTKRIRAFRQAYLYNAIDKPRNRGSWTKSPLDVNAFYNRPNNKIILPVAIVANEFNSDEISVVDYGRIGSILGHEILHGFDNTGRLYDQDGLMIPWWSEETNKNFIQAKSCFEEQYGTYYIPEINDYVNPTASIDENLADNGGIRESYQAYTKIENTQPQVTENFTNEQLFFISYATAFCANESPSYISANTKYSPARWRVNGPLRNMVQFGEAFSCPVESSMNPKDKCILW